MKKGHLLFTFCISVILANAQVVKKLPIGNSGCSLSAYCDFRFDAKYSEDSSIVYVGECVKEEISYGVICVKLSVPADDLDKAEKLTITYLDYLKSSLKILKSAGYSTNHLLANDKKTRGIFDNWEDSDKLKWKIKGWTNGAFIGVVYAFSTNALPDSKLDAFLDSFRFPAL